VLAAALVGMVTITTQFLMRSINSLSAQFTAQLTAQITGLRNELRTDIGALRTEMDLRFTHLQM
jgi:hypothetical protein